MSTQKQTKRSRMKRAVHAFGRTVQHYSPKVLSVFLSLLLIYQCFMTDGVSYALAEALDSNTATELSVDQENLSDDAVPDSGQEESAVTSSQEETTGSEETSQSDDASSADTTNDQTTSPSNTSPSEQTDNAGQQQDAASDNSQTDASKPEETIAERTEVHSWNGDVDALALSSKGLTFTNSSESMQSALSGNADSSDTRNQNLSETLSVPADPDAPASAETILPEQLDATLNLSFKVDPSLWSDNPEQTRASVIAGDSFSVELPEGITPSDASTKFDVYQINADGSTSSIRIATARVENNSLIVTFSDPLSLIPWIPPQALRILLGLLLILLILKFSPLFRRPSTLMYRFHRRLFIKMHTTWNGSFKPHKTVVHKQRSCIFLQLLNWRTSLDSLMPPTKMLKTMP